MRLLAARDRSAHEVRHALAERGVEAAQIEATLDRLRELCYVDDRRLATAVAERALRRGFGSQRVSAELVSRGVPDSLVAAAVAAAFTGEEGLAREVCRRRFGVVPPAPDDRIDAARFLLARGFPESVVLAIVGEGC